MFPANYRAAAPTKQSAPQPRSRQSKIGNRLACVSNPTLTGDCRWTLSKPLATALWDALRSRLAPPSYTITGDTTQYAVWISDPGWCGSRLVFAGNEEISHAEVW